MQRRLGMLLVGALVVAGFCLVVPGQGTGEDEGKVRLYLAAGFAFDPLDGSPAAADLRAPRLENDEEGFFIVQFDGPVGAGERAALASAGAEIFSYLPDFAFLVRMTPAKATGLASAEGVRWTGRWEPALRVGPSITTAPVAGNLAAR